jgi:hypothetical protein
LRSFRFFSRLRVNLAGLRIDQVFGDIAADQLRIGHAQRLETLFSELARLPDGKLLAGFQDNLAGIGIDQVVDRLVSPETGGIERNAPSVLLPLELNLAIEGVQNFFGIEGQGVEQRRHRDFPAPVDAGIDDVLGVKLDVEP